MATSEVTIHLSPAQGRTSSTTNPSPRPCNHCGRPVTNLILANRKAYCCKLCAAVRLIADAYVELKLDDEFFNDSFGPLLDSAFGDETPKHPVTARWADAVDVQVGMDSVLFVIDDDGTPDLVPDPLDLDASQICIDAAIERIAVA